MDKRASWLSNNYKTINKKQRNKRIKVVRKPVYVCEEGAEARNYTVQRPDKEFGSLLSESGSLLDEFGTEN